MEISETAKAISEGTIFSVKNKKLRPMGKGSKEENGMEKVNESVSAEIEEQMKRICGAPK